MLIVMKIIKVAIAFALLVSLAVGGNFLYYEYQESQRRQGMLDFGSKSNLVTWSFLNDHDDIQIRKMDGKSSLRRVNLREQYAIVASLQNDYSLVAVIYFKTDCEPNTVIETSKNYSDGSFKTLGCMDDGKYLAHLAFFGTGGKKVTWEDNLDGFKFREDFSYWDFSKLEREITLTKAKKNKPSN